MKKLNQKKKPATCKPELIPSGCYPALITAANRRKIGRKGECLTLGLRIVAGEMAGREIAALIVLASPNGLPDSLGVAMLGQLCRATGETERGDGSRFLRRQVMIRVISAGGESLVVGFHPISGEAEAPTPKKREPRTNGSVTLDIHNAQESGDAIACAYLIGRLGNLSSATRGFSNALAAIGMIFGQPHQS